MENEKQYWWLWNVQAESNPVVFLEHVASRIYGEFCAEDWTFEEMMDAVSAIHRIEAEHEEVN